jgi:glycosyltransferase involved in cell wall biosynthesis
MSADNIHVISISDSVTEDGGADISALLGTLELLRRGAQVTVFAGTGPISSRLAEMPNLKTICLNQQHILHNSNRLAAATQGIWNFQAARELRTVIKSSDRRRTVLHVHTWQKCLSSSVLEVALGSGLPVVITAHGFELVCPIGTLFRSNESRPCDLTPVSRQCALCNCDPRSYAHKVWRVARQIVQQGITTRAKGVCNIVVGSRFAGRVLSKYLPETFPMHVIPPPIDLSIPSQVTMPTDDAPMCFVGRFSKEKGADLWARTARVLGVPAVFVGDGPMRAELERLCPHAQFRGWLSPQETARAIRDSRGLVFPSLCLETYGRVVAEAAALGRGAVVADGCAASDLVVDGETGTHFRIGDGDSLLEKVSQFLVPGTAARLGQAAFNRYWSNPHSVICHGDQLMKLYEGILDRTLQVESLSAE